ncbi:hypothetical protein IRP63_06560 [Clostridium botulinum]|uniref:Phage protein n=1 Tax=Clostridium botulinum C/D str. DC5 TaxID=1443128 RepID=A0A0A0ICL8_CLOBO|nr:hypothetical protein [Clostridium botulinum]KEI00421.1 hypothetical protein Z952_01060 [Clostridium botulinum C/D str. BKT75002]KEI12679.1 hypothetical protein Z954_05340 [Clostridium botulinum C/D str. BKT2873]KGM95240.1 hypothetical protein Z956_05450 [Clostridium botulinum D str. CCUG 7971]KGM99189.1 hypothetical protein Z955_08705 [Clostridium botulinum C/D str. DC5]KOC46099.1 hypothetical protein ADU88_12660 [Clostridium botulinum]
MAKDIFEAYFNANRQVELAKEQLFKHEITGDKFKVNQLKKQYEEALKIKKSIEDSEQFKNCALKLIKGMLAGN